MVESIGEEISTKYPSLFTGLGSFPDTYSIKLSPVAQPYALCTWRNISLPLCQKVQTELERVESLGFISQMDAPTPWCARIMVVPNKDSSVHIYVDFRQKYTFYQKVEETLAQLHGAVMLSNVNANCGFWQVPLDDNSKPLHHAFWKIQFY